MLFAHYSVPLIGARLVAINTRLSPLEMQYIFEHSESVMLFGDPQLLAQVTDLDLPPVRLRVELPGQDDSYQGVAGTIRYTDFTASGSTADTYAWEPLDEEDVITINYTSGTTGKPKGVMYSHRGAFLNSISEMHHQGLTKSSRYLWTLPMFHCNGWCNTWAVTAAAATHICLREVRGDIIWDLIDNEQVSHLCGAPTVLSIFATAPQARELASSLTISTAGAPPTPTIIEKILSLGAELIHVYGLTETYGPYSVCEWQTDWEQLPAGERSAKMSRQGVGMLTANTLRVVRSELSAEGALVDVESDGVEMGELVMRGNNVMKGYLNDPEGTAQAFRGGWFHSGDLGVMHADGYVQILDREKDIIISGGENISTIEVEQAIASHPDVVDVAVVGIADEEWGERPVAFIVAGDSAISEEILIAHTRTKIAGYKVPRVYKFVEELPKTSTGKVRKADLRELV